MAFIDQFPLYFDEYQKYSEMYGMLLKIGENVEKSIVEDVQLAVLEHTDYTYMTAETIRSYLSYGLISLPVATPATGKATLVIDSAIGSVRTIPAGTQVRSNSGIVFTQLETISGLSQGSTATISVTNSRTAQYPSTDTTRTYNSFMYFSASGVNTSDISVVVLPDSSDPESGGVVPPVAEEQGLKLPYNGFVAFYFNEHLFIKIYEGPDVPAFAGKVVQVTYGYSDGASGNIPASSLTSYASTITDSTGRVVSYHFVHDVFTGGADAPTLDDLQGYLRKYLFAKNSITKSSDFDAWFMAQPDVGDCFIYTDQDYFHDTGTVKLTGLVNVCLLSPDKAPLPKLTTLRLDSSLKPHRDLGICQYIDPIPVSLVAEVSVTSSSDADNFFVVAKETINNFFDMGWCRTLGMSLFSALPVQSVLSLISSNYLDTTSVTAIPFGVNLLFKYRKLYTVSPGSLTRSYEFFTGFVKKGATEYFFTYTPPAAPVPRRKSAIALFVAHLPYKVSYHYRETVDYTGLLVYYVYEDGTYSNPLSVPNLKYSGSPFPQESGTLDISVELGGFSTTIRLFAVRDKDTDTQALTNVAVVKTNYLSPIVNSLPEDLSDFYFQYVYDDGSITLPDPSTGDYLHGDVVAQPGTALEVTKSADGHTSIWDMPVIFKSADTSKPQIEYLFSITLRFVVSTSETVDPAFATATLTDYFHLQRPFSTTQSIPVGMNISTAGGPYTNSVPGVYPREGYDIFSDRSLTVVYKDVVDGRNRTATAVADGYLHDTFSRSSLVEVEQGLSMQELRLWPTTEALPVFTYALVETASTPSETATPVTVEFVEQRTQSDIYPIIDDKDRAIGYHNYTSGLIVFSNPPLVMSYGGSLAVEGEMKDPALVENGTLYGYRTLDNGGGIRTFVSGNLLTSSVAGETTDI